MRAAVVVVLLASCGRFDFEDLPDAPPPVPSVVRSWTPGQRLHAEVADFGNGARSFVGWRDRQFDVKCELRTTVDGERRCLPQAMNINFRDPACTQPIGFWRPEQGAVVPQFAYELAPVNRYKMFSLLGEVPAGDYYYITNGTCVGPYPNPATNRHYLVGPEVDLGQFVRVTDATFGTTRLQAYGWRADDGATETEYAYDTKFGVRCYFGETTAGVRCIPFANAASDYYADAACTVRLATSYGTPPLELVADSPACEPTRVYRAGATWTQAVYLKSGNSCMPTTPSTEVLTIGDEIDPSELVGATEIIEPTGGRLSIRSLIADDGTRQWEGFRDTQRDEDCDAWTNFEPTTDARCLPSETAFSGGYFTDAACSIPMAPSFGPSCSPRYLVLADFRGNAVHTINSAAPAPTQRHFWGGFCAPIGLETGKSYVVGGAAIPFTEFAAGTFAVE